MKMADDLPPFRLEKPGWGSVYLHVWPFKQCHTVQETARFPVRWFQKPAAGPEAVGSPSSFAETPRHPVETTRSKGKLSMLRFLKTNWDSSILESSEVNPLSTPFNDQFVSGCSKALMPLTWRPAESISRN